VVGRLGIALEMKSRVEWFGMGWRWYGVQHRHLPIQPATGSLLDNARSQLTGPTAALVRNKIRKLQGGGDFIPKQSFWSEVVRHMGGGIELSVF
jgi:hypothetical protein